MKAIETTASSLDQIIFEGFTHEPAERLAEALVGLAPAGPVARMTPVTPAVSVNGRIGLAWYCCRRHITPVHPKPGCHSSDF